MLLPPLANAVDDSYRYRVREVCKIEYAGGLSGATFSLEHGGGRENCTVLGCEQQKLERGIQKYRDRQTGRQSRRQKQLCHCGQTLERRVPAFQPQLSCVSL